jgi:hypothetical protein
LRSGSFHPRRLAAREVVAARHLERRLDGLAPAAHRVQVRVLHREQRRELVGIGLHGLGREHRAVDVLRAAELSLDRLDHLGHAVADVHDDRAAERPRPDNASRRRR